MLTLFFLFSIPIIICLCVNIVHNEYSYFEVRIKETIANQGELSEHYVLQYLQTSGPIVTIIAHISLWTKYIGILYIIIGIGLSIYSEVMPHVVHLSAGICCLIAGLHIALWQRRRRAIYKKGADAGIRRRCGDSEIVKLLDVGGSSSQLLEHIQYGRIDAYRIALVILGLQPYLYVKEMLLERLPITFFLFVIMWYFLQVIMQ